jgi:hypothetical protein
LGDFDSDGDLDVLANGEDSATAVQLRIYKSQRGQFHLGRRHRQRRGIYVENGLTYDMQISTVSNFSKLSSSPAKWAQARVWEAT